MTRSRPSAARLAAALCFTAAALASTVSAAPARNPAAPAASPAGARIAPMPEPAKIEALIHSVETLPGAVFIRNGSEYDGRTAAAHLRRKLKAAGKRVRTADQFITVLATGSSMTGKPYRIRYADGRTVESAVYFREQLRRLESTPTASRG